jgi:DNA (cytosine-5)-methyltransferase 1
MKKKMEQPSLFDEFESVPTKSDLSYISLFSGAGIGCYGFLLEKFECIATLELLEKRLNIQKVNNKCYRKQGYIVGDIREAGVKDAIFTEIKHWNVAHKEKDVTVLLATPPCQGMSVANHKKKDEKGRNSLVVESIVLTKKIKPLFFVFENVAAFLNTACTDIDGTDKSIKDAIFTSLSGLYNIHNQVVNFKDRGNNSSRTRTLVIGVRWDMTGIAPISLMPVQRKCPTLRESIGNLKPLNNMGDIAPDDIFHHFRPYKKEMLPWIQGLTEGQSAFDNENSSLIPHQILDGKIVYNQNKNGDKYRRCIWDESAPCIHTRNDILSSQNTIHPQDNRVFSVRELMRLMTIPDSFKWTDDNYEKLNSRSLQEKKSFLSKEELNIRHSIGEAVPTAIFRAIAANIKKNLIRKNFNKNEAKKLIEENEFTRLDKLVCALHEKRNDFSFHDWAKIIEYSNSNRTDHAAYFTPQGIAFSLVNELPDFQGRKTIRILEPSVGTGNFLPFIFLKYQHISEVVIDVIDIDPTAIDILIRLIAKFGNPPNVKINYIVDDFLLHSFKTRYDVIIANPPFKKLLDNPDKILQYRQGVINNKTTNIAAFFLEKAIKLSDYVAFVIPKSFLNTPEYNLTRQFMSEHTIKTIFDYGESGFEDVKIETIGVVFRITAVSPENTVKIISLVTGGCEIKKQIYVFSPEYPCALLYRNEFFDTVANKMTLGIFSVVRDRQITKKNTQRQGVYLVLKARNIGNNEIIYNKGKDVFVDNIESLAIRKFLNNTDVVLVPNLTYKPRACFLPENCIVDGSVAILQLKYETTLIPEDLEYFASTEFQQFYMIARNHGSRSLNIDSNSVFFFGKRKSLNEK